jgi:hypothetical protein
MEKIKTDLELDFFKETFKLLNVDQRKFEYRLKSHPFDRQQKKLLEAFLFFKRNNKEEVFQRLKTVPLENKFLEATRCYLLGMAQNHFGFFKFAAEHLSLAVKDYQSLDEDEFVVYPLTVLVLTYGNMKDLKKMEETVDLMKSYQASGDFSHLLMVHAEVLYLLQSNQFLKANKLLNNQLKKENSFLEMFLPSFLLIKFSISFNQKDYDSCFKILEEYKISKGFIVRVNYLYMKSLLDHIAKAKALYVYESDFRDYPELHHQLEVIKALSRGDGKRAELFWKLLAKHNPSVYQNEFTYSSGEGLFSVALRMYLGNANKKEISQSHLTQLKSPMEKLEYLLTEIDIPHSKADLIKLIWNEDVSEKALNRLRKLVFDFNQKSKSKIVSHHDTYKVVSKAS